MKTTNPRKYPNTLKEQRLNLQLTQNEVAQKLGFSNSDDRISHWELGQTLPNVLNLFKLCRIYGVTPQDIYPALAH